MVRMVRFVGHTCVDGGAQWGAPMGSHIGKTVVKERRHLQWLLRISSVLPATSPYQHPLIFSFPILPEPP